MMGKCEMSLAEDVISAVCPPRVGAASNAKGGAAKAALQSLDLDLRSDLNLGIG
jgi:hypothetical protein